MTQTMQDATSVASARLEGCYSGTVCNWERFYKPVKEMRNFATRYHLVYPALAYYVALKHNPRKADQFRPQLDTIYRGLLDPRCWTYWYSELRETTWPLQERNLTYAGRLATFVGLYIDAFGEPPAERIEIDGRSTTYNELSETLARQMQESPSCGVSCYYHQSMVMCNAHMLINNVLHDRLFGTNYSSLNEAWISTVEDHLFRDGDSGPIFFYGTQADSQMPIEEKRAIGADIWALFLMSGVMRGRVAAWFEQWQRNIIVVGQSAHISVTAWEAENEFSSDELATAWAFCLTKELGHNEISKVLRNYLEPKVLVGLERDPYISGLFLLGEQLAAGDFHRLIQGSDGQD